MLVDALMIEQDGREWMFEKEEENVISNILGCNKAFYAP